MREEDSPRDGAPILDIWRRTGFAALKHLVGKMTEIPSFVRLREFVDENALSVAVRRLRAKLGDAPIKTVYGVGYTWEVER